MSERRRNALAPVFETMGDAAWLVRLREFAADCARSGAAAQGELLAEAARLFRGVPSPEIATLLAARAHESAALQLLGPDAGYMLSRGGHGVHIASVVLPGSANEATAEGASAALALLGAYAEALLDAAQSGEWATRSVCAPGMLN